MLHTPHRSRTGDTCVMMRNNSLPFVLAPLWQSLCLFWHEIHIKGLSARPEVEERRKVPEKTERRSWQSRAEENGRLEIAVQGKDGQQKEAVRKDSQRWVSIPRGCVEVSCKIHACNSLQMHEELHKKCHIESPFLSLELTQVRVCSFFLSFTLSIVFCVSVKKCVIPLVGNQ